MQSIAFFLVLASAFIHALWNLAAKQAKGDSVFFWRFTLFEVLIYSVFAIFWGIEFSLDLVLFALLSSIIHIAYFLFLLQAYKIGDLSLVYPLSRGLGPVLAMLGAMFIFQENPSVLDWLGALIIAASVWGLTGNSKTSGKSNELAAIGYAALIAISIAVYTLWDSYAVKTGQVDAFLYLWINGVFRFLFLSPFAYRKRHELAEGWKKELVPAVIVGAGSLGGYLLFLWAASLADVSYISPLRSLSILFGVILASNFLKEGDKWRRVIATSLMVLGIILLNL